MENNNNEDIVKDDVIRDSPSPALEEGSNVGGGDLIPISDNTPQVMSASDGILPYSYNGISEAIYEARLKTIHNSNSVVDAGGYYSLFTITPTSSTASYIDATVPFMFSLADSGYRENWNCLLLFRVRLDTVILEIQYLTNYKRFLRPNDFVIVSNTQTGWSMPTITVLYKKYATYTRAILSRLGGYGSQVNITYNKSIVTTLPEGTVTYGQALNTQPIIIGQSNMTNILLIDKSTTSDKLKELFSPWWKIIVNGADYLGTEGRLGISLYFWTPIAVVPVKQIQSMNTDSVQNVSFLFDITINDIGTSDPTVRTKMLSIQRNIQSNTFTCIDSKWLATSSIVVGDPGTLSNSSASDTIINTLFLGNKDAFDQIWGTWYKCFTNTNTNKSFGGIPVYSIAGGKVRNILAIECVDNQSTRDLTLDVQNTSSHVRTVTVRKAMQVTGQPLSVTYVLSKTIADYYGLNIPTIVTLETKMRILMESADFSAYVNKPARNIFPNITSVSGYLTTNNPNVIIMISDVDNTYIGNSVVNHNLFLNSFNIDFTMQFTLLSIQIDTSYNIISISRKWWNYDPA